MLCNLTNLSGFYSTSLMVSAKKSFIPSLISELTPVMVNLSSISSAIDDALFQKLLLASNPQDKARLLSASAPHAGDFLICLPIPDLGLKLSKNEWSVAVGYRLGVNFLTSPMKCKATGCSKMLDVQALHALRCGTEGDRLKRHNNLRNFFFNECRKAMMSPVLEPNNLLRNSSARPADWGIPDFRPGKFMAYDVAVTDPTQDAFVKFSSRTRGGAAETYASETKVAKYSDALRKDDSLLFTPIIAETYGAWNSKASDFFNDLSSWLATRDVSAKSSGIRSRLFQKASVIIQRANSRMILSRIQTVCS